MFKTTLLGRLIFHSLYQDLSLEELCALTIAIVSAISPKREGIMNNYKSLNHRKICSHHGFTLVEILVSITILTLGVLAVSQMTLLGMRVTSVNKQRIYARIALSQVFENLNNLPSSDSLLVDDGDVSDLNDMGSTADYSQIIEDVTAGFRYQARWNIADNTPELNMKTIRIHILWGTNNKHHISSDLIKKM